MKELHFVICISNRNTNMKVIFFCLHLYMWLTIISDNHNRTFIIYKYIYKIWIMHLMIKHHDQVYSLHFLNSDIFPSFSNMLHSVWPYIFNNLTFRLNLLFCRLDRTLLWWQISRNTYTFEDSWNMLYIDF